MKNIQEGYSERLYQNKKYGISKSTFNNGKSIKLYGEELGGKNFISLNYYITNDKEILKPCEMQEAKVVDFLKQVELIVGEQNGQN